MNIKTFWLTAIVATLSLCACHERKTAADYAGDTAVKSATDTSHIPGSPGASGSMPGPNDTTQKHKDSLRMAAAISDTSSGALSGSSPADSGKSK